MVSFVFEPFTSISLIYSLIHSSNHCLIDLFIPALSHSFINSFISSFLHPLILCSSIHHPASCRITFIHPPIHSGRESSWTLRICAVCTFPSTRIFRRITRTILADVLRDIVTSFSSTVIIAPYWPRLKIISSPSPVRHFAITFLRKQILISLLRVAPGNICREKRIIRKTYLVWPAIAISTSTALFDLKPLQAKTNKLNQRFKNAKKWRKTGSFVCVTFSRFRCKGSSNIRCFWEIYTSTPSIHIPTEKVNFLVGNADRVRGLSVIWDRVFIFRRKQWVK